MMMLWVLIPLSAVLLIAAGWAFFWAVDNDQMDDLEKAQRMALELDDEPDQSHENESQSKT